MWRYVLLGNFLCMTFTTVELIYCRTPLFIIIIIEIKTNTANERQNHICHHLFSPLLIRNFMKITPLELLRKYSILQELFFSPFSFASLEKLKFSWDENFARCPGIALQKERNFRCVSSIGFFIVLCRIEAAVLSWQRFIIIVHYYFPNYMALSLSLSYTKDSRR